MNGMSASSPARRPAPAGLAEFSVLARRPPRTLESAQHLAAEQWAFCNEFGGTGLHDVPSITASLMNSPIWTFWWD
jgi:hypothetical protein